jgi:hypothetical protein
MNSGCQLILHIIDEFWMSTDSAYTKEPSMYGENARTDKLIYTLTAPASGLRDSCLRR